MTGGKMREKSKFASRINADSTVQPFGEKYFPLPIGQIIFITPRHPAPEGAFRGRHGRGAGCDGRGSTERRTVFPRTAKSWRPDTPMLVSSSWGANASQG
jgi:hypothetical protein